VDAVAESDFFKYPIAVFHKPIEQVNVIVGRSIYDENLCKSEGERSPITIIPATIEKIGEEFYQCRKRPAILRCHITKEIVDEIGKVSGDPLVRPRLQSVESLDGHDGAHLFRPRNTQEFFKGHKDHIRREFRRGIDVERRFY
jgi:hypothetical protein